MATSELRSSGGSLSAYQQGGIDYVYLVKTDQVERNPAVVLSIGQSASGEPVPAAFSLLSGTPYFYAQNFTMQRLNENRLFWEITVTFAPPDNQGQDAAQMIENPLNRPARFYVRYRDTQKAVTEATNKDAIPGAGNRPAGELGPIVNGIGDSPLGNLLYKVVRYPVYVIEQNIADLATMVTLNEDFENTTNSDTVNVYGTNVGPHKLKFLGASTGYPVTEGAYNYYVMTVEIEQQETTDYLFPNESLEEKDANGGKQPILDAKGKPFRTPVAITLNGTKKEDGVVENITYYYLEEKAYAGFFP